MVRKANRDVYCLSEGERHYALRDFCARQSADVPEWEGESLQDRFLDSLVAGVCRK